MGGQGSRVWRLDSCPRYWRRGCAAAGAADPHRQWLLFGRDLRACGTDGSGETQSVCSLQTVACRRGVVTMDGGPDASQFGYRQTAGRTAGAGGGCHGDLRTWEHWNELEGALLSVAA